MSEKEKTVFEGEREIPVYTECDLLVVGGGAAGHSAAVAAARATRPGVEGARGSFAAAWPLPHAHKPALANHLPAATSVKSDEPETDGLPAMR